VLITVLTGSLISGISLGLMLLVSDRLRTGLFELDQIERRLRDSREALSRSQALLESSRTAVRTAEQGRQQARSQLTRVEGQARQLRGELAPLMQQRQLLEQERDRLNRDINARDTDIRRNREELARLNSRIAAGSKELQSLETNLIALRRGDVVITAGQPLEIAKVRIDNGDQAQAVIEALLRQANSNVYQLVLPGQAPNRQILLVPKSDINRLEQVLRRRGEWVVSVISAANVLKGERQVVAFPDVRPNKRVVKAGEVLASSALEADETSPDQVRSRLNLLLAAAFNRVKQQGSLTSGLQFDPAALNQLGIQLSGRPAGPAVQLEVVALQSRDLAEPVAVEIRIRR
jgi:uncharacterized protein (DUF3084 family)